MTQPQPPSPASGAAKPGDGVMKRVIPTKNKPALFGYYCGVFAFIPGFGVPLVPAAVLLGCLGLWKVGQDPRVHGKGHAWAAIVLGVLAGCSQPFTLPLILDRFGIK